MLVVSCKLTLPLIGKQNKKKKDFEEKTRPIQKKKQRRPLQKRKQRPMQDPYAIKVTKRDPYKRENKESV